jgi:hypothetical protein
MHEDDNELCTLRWEDVARPPNPYAIGQWFRAERHYQAVTLIARQLAFDAAGPTYARYLARHRHRLMAEAADIISSRPGFARYRPR